MDRTIITDRNGVHTEVHYHAADPGSPFHGWYTSHGTGHHYGVLLALLLVWTVLYFLPSLIARGRRVHNWLAVLLVNFLTGWTGLGWFAALIMALAMERRWEYEMRMRFYHAQLGSLTPSGGRPAAP